MNSGPRRWVKPTYRGSRPNRSETIVPRQMPFGKPWMCETCGEPVGVFSTDPRMLDGDKPADTIQIKRKDMYVNITLIRGRVDVTCYRCGRISSVSATAHQIVTGPSET